MTQADPAATTHSLTELPECSRLRAVTAVPAEVAGRRALRVELTDAVTLEGKSGVDYVDMPTSVIIPASYINGTIEVDILSRLNGKGPADARAFAGIAFRVTADGDHFEAVYLRPLNEQRTNPPSPRDQRAIQYFAYPDWKFDRLREQYPDEDYEAAVEDCSADGCLVFTPKRMGARSLPLVRRHRDCLTVLAAARASPDSMGASDSGPGLHASDPPVSPSPAELLAADRYLEPARSEIAS